MKWPIVKPLAPAEAAPSQGQAGAQALGINRTRGEGGFWARILFQDETLPWRYAFAQMHRVYDNTAYPAPGEIEFFKCWVDRTSNGEPINNNTGSYFYTNAGEQSVWNIGNEAPDIPFAQVGTLAGGIALPAGRVFNWCNEVNHCQSVPNGAIVWLRQGEHYDDPALLTPTDDYNFQWSAPVWAKITGQAKTSTNDPGGNGNYTWIEQYRERALIANPDQVAWADAINPRQSNPNGNGLQVAPIISPAREINGNTTVPAGTFVLLQPGQVIAYNPDGTVYSQEWLFQYDVLLEEADCTLGGGSTASKIIATTQMTLAPNNLPPGAGTPNLQIVNGVDGGTNNALGFYRPGVYEIHAWVSILDNDLASGPYFSGAKLEIYQSAAGAVPGGSFVVVEGLYGYGDGTCYGCLALTTILTISAADIAGNSNQILFKVTSLGTTTPGNLKVNDGELVVHIIDNNPGAAGAQS